MLERSGFPWSFKYSSSALYTARNLRRRAYEYFINVVPFPMPSQHTVLYAEETRRMVQWIPLKVTVANKSAPVEHHTPSHTTYR